MLTSGALPCFEALTIPFVDPFAAQTTASRLSALTVYLACRWDFFYPTHPPRTAPTMLTRPSSGEE